MLLLDQLRFRYPGSATVYDFSCRIKTGEIVCVMGESGSGKSTLLDLIAGFRLPDSGILRWKDVGMIPLPPEDRPVTVLFQDHNVFDHLTAWRNVSLGLNRGGHIDAAQSGAVADALLRVGLDGLENRVVSDLSGGQQQRVAIARTLVRNCPIALLDEPFNGLDDETKHGMLQLVRDMASKENRCILLVTHDRQDADAIADRILKLENGALQPD